MVSARERVDVPDRDRDVRAYLTFEAARWPDGSPTCPHCGTAGRSRLLVPTAAAGRRTRTGRVTARRVWRCAGCRCQFSVLTGTVFERTRVPLAVWLEAIAAGDGGAPTAGTVAAVTGVDRRTASAMATLVHFGLAAAGPLGAAPAGTAQPQG